MKLVRKPSPKDGWYEITPTSAQSILDGRAKNRRLREFRAQRIAADIASGAWRENGESIIFDEKVRCIDGQTRLRACVLANAPIVAYCVFDVPYQVFPSLDQGKSRTGSDLAGLMGFKNETCVAAVARLAMLYADGTIGATGAKAVVHNDKLRAYMSRNREELSASVAEAYQRRNGIVKLIPMSQAAFIHYAAATRHPAEAEDFLDKLATGAGLKRDDAILKFRDRMRELAGKKHKLLALEKLALLIKTWNFYVNQKSPGCLKWNRDLELFPKLNGGVLDE